MIQFKEGFYADIRIEDRSSTVIAYQAGVLDEMKNRVEKQAFLRVYDGKLWGPGQRLKQFEGAIPPFKS